MNYLGWLFDPANWSGQGGVPERLLQHVGYTALTMIIALVSHIFSALTPAIRADLEWKAQRGAAELVDG